MVKWAVNVMCANSNSDVISILNQGRSTEGDRIPVVMKLYRKL